MNKGFISSAFVLVLTGALMIAMSPDVVSLLFVAVMCLIVVLGMVMGLLPCTNFYQNFKAARKSIRRIAGTSSNDPWLVLQQSPDLFRYPQLNRLFKEYMDKANRQHSRGEGFDGLIRDRENGFLCAPGDDSALLDTLEHIAQLPPQERVRLIGASYALASSMTEDQTTEGFLRANSAQP